MRDYLFRGKRSYEHWRNEDPWVYGSLIQAKDYCCILNPDDENDMDYPYLDGDLGTIDGSAIPVIPETVGQFTGIIDKNGTRIFEGDIIKTIEGAFPVVCRSGAVWLYDELLLSNDHLDFLGSYIPNAIEVIGNIHDNPELLRGE